MATLLPPDPPKKLTPQEKNSWNKFIDFVKVQGVNPAVLDQRNKQVGMSLLQKFNFANPQNALDTAIVPKVQQEFQDYRNGLVNDWKAGKAQVDGVKSEDEIMPNISPVDGWPGSKTLSHKFPIATIESEDNGKKTVQNFGTDMDAYAKAKQNYAPQIPIK